MNTVDERPTSRWIAFGVLLAASIALVGGIFFTLWQPLLIAAVLAGTLSRFHDRLAARLKERRALSASILTLAVVLFLLVPLVILIVIGVDQAIGGVAFVRDALAIGGTPELIGKLPAPIRPVGTWAFELLHNRTSDLQSQVTNGGKVALAVVSGAVSATSSVLFDLAIFLIAFFALLTDGKRLVAWIQETSPMRNRQTVELFREFRLVSRTVVGSMMATAGVQAGAATVGYLIAGVPQAGFFGLLTFIASFVPSIGTAIVAVPIAGLLLLLGKTLAGVFLLCWSVLVVGLVDNLLKPLLMKGDMNLNGAVVFFSLIGGALLFGPVGLIVGPLALAFFLTMLRLAQRDFSPQ
jgi:predicted PurR-regulated permease PerM